MKKKQSAKPVPRLVRIKDAAHILGVPLNAMPQLTRLTGCTLLKDESEEPCIASDEFERFHDHPSTIYLANQAFRSAAERRLRDAPSGADKYFASEIEAKLAEYRNFISLLERIHAKYLPRMQPVVEQAPLKAAYLLYGRVINLLNMGCVCLRAGYWNGGLVLRQIDEAVQVAEYFSFSGSNAQLEIDVSRWFRQNRTPRPVDIRKAFANRFAEKFGEDQGRKLLRSMDDLYETKSKWVHPAFSPIRETLRTFPIENSAEITGFDYGPCSSPRKIHELVLFYRSSIWTAVQGFVLCFEAQIPLDREDANALFLIDQQFGNS